MKTQNQNNDIDKNIEDEKENLGVNFEETGEGVVVTVLYSGTASSVDDSHPKDANGKDKPDFLFYDGELIANTTNKTIFSTTGPGISLPGPGSNSPLHENHYAATQKVFGYGIEKNINLVMDLLKETAKNHPIKCVNMVGWSRGAAAAITTATRMRYCEDLKIIPVNLFGVEPVPGIGNPTKENTIIHSNVKNAIFLYAKNERSPGFSAVVPVRSFNNKTSKIKVIALPGHHATLSGNPYWHWAKQYNGKDIFLPEPGHIVRWMVEQFLVKLGTTLQDDPRQKLSSLTKYQLLHELDIIKKSINEYKSLENESYIGKTQFFGNSRKITHGWSNWFNAELSDVIGEDDSDGLDKTFTSLYKFIQDSEEQVDILKLFDSDLCCTRENNESYEPTKEDLEANRNRLELSHNEMLSINNALHPKEKTADKIGAELSFTNNKKLNPISTSTDTDEIFADEKDIIMSKLDDVTKSRCYNQERIISALRNQNAHINVKYKKAMEEMNVKFEKQEQTLQNVKNEMKSLEQINAKLSIENENLKMPQPAIVKESNNSGLYRIFSSFFNSGTVCKKTQVVKVPGYTDEEFVKMINESFMSDINEPDKKERMMKV